MDMPIAGEISEGRAAGHSPFQFPANLTYGGEYDENGVDVSLIRYMLTLSPLERIVRMQDHAKQCWMLYELGRHHREAQSAKTR